jgi:hypothetical protein
VSNLSREYNFAVGLPAYLKEYLLRGFVIGHRIERIEKLAIETGQRVTENEKELSGPLIYR